MVSSAKKRAAQRAALFRLGFRSRESNRTHGVSLSFCLGAGGATGGAGTVAAAGTVTRAPAIHGAAFGTAVFGTAALRPCAVRTTVVALSGAAIVAACVLRATLTTWSAAFAIRRTAIVPRLGGTAGAIDARTVAGPVTVAVVATLGSPVGALEITLAFMRATIAHRTLGATMFTTGTAAVTGRAATFTVVAPRLERTALAAWRIGARTLAVRTVATGTVALRAITARAITE